MGLFSKKKPKATDSISPNKSIFWGGSTSGVPVSEQSAMQTASVYACVRAISETIASLPLNIYSYEEHGSKIATDHSLYNLLHYEPNPEMTSFQFRETLMSHLLLWGNAYAQIMRDRNGTVTALYPLLPNKMDVWRSTGGEIFYTYWRDLDEAHPHEKSGDVTLSKRDVLHIAGLSFNGLVGLSPIGLAKNAIGMAIATENYGAGFFANGANPGGILEHPSTIKNPASVRDAWESLYKGSGNSGKVAVLEDGLKFHTISIPPEQAQFLETRKFQLNEIARIFRIPPHMIGDLEKSSFSNIEQQSLEFVKYTLDPWVVRLEQSMCQSLLLPSEKSKYFIQFNLNALLRGDYSTRMNGYAIARQNGWMSANDIRELENLNRIPEDDGGDLYLVNGNMVKLTDAGIAYGKEDKANE